jgi:hypothetical protein
VSLRRVDRLHGRSAGWVSKDACQTAATGPGPARSRRRLARAEFRYGVAADVVRAANDKQRLAPMLNTVVALPEALGNAGTLLVGLILGGGEAAKTMPAGCDT